MAKINKALDYNKLLIDQSNGKLLKKYLQFGLWASVKYDGNYVVVHVSDKGTTFETSGGLFYTHLDNAGDVFANGLKGFYFAERIAGKGKLGDRNKCNLKGPKHAQTSEGHSYKVFGYVTEEEYAQGYSNVMYPYMATIISKTIPVDSIAEPVFIDNINKLNSLLSYTTSIGYEGLMLMATDYSWKDTKTRTVKLAKYKKRPTADLKCIGVTEGEGKYTGLIGSLILEDDEGRVVNVGSGLNDADRNAKPGYFIGRVVEIEYEHIVDTYIQPTYKFIRKDK